MRHLYEDRDRRDNRLGLAIAGCGDVAGYTAWFARLNRGIRLVACCDSAPERAAQFARRFHIPRACTGYAELLSDGARPDALYLAVPHHLHRPMVEAALAAGVPVLVEKPLALTPGEGRQMVAAAEAAGVKLGINYQYRPYLTPAAEALPVLAAVDAIYRSSRTGYREEIDL
jgi:predicted dehydrogenase